jgi:hypothetical protein
MATPGVGLRDITERKVSRLRLLAPLRYLAIHHPEKTTYDLIAPIGVTIVACVAYFWIQPHPAIFGEAGILKFTRDLLIMAVPFMIGALAAVAMGSPGPHLDKRPVGTDLLLDGEVLTMRQFVCYLLGYLSFLSLLVLLLSIGATLLHGQVVSWTAAYPKLLLPVKIAGVSVLSFLLSTLTITVLWSLYFLTDVVNRKI